MKITSPITYADILDWRIHWLYCELEQLNDDMIRNPKPIEEHIEKMKQITSQQFERVMWEVSTMMGDDTYSSEIKEQCQELKAYKRFVASLEQVKENLRRRFQREAEMAATNLEAQLTSRF